MEKLKGKFNEFKNSKLSNLKNVIAWWVTTITLMWSSLPHKENLPKHIQNTISTFQNKVSKSILETEWDKIVWNFKSIQKPENFKTSEITLKNFERKPKLYKI